MTATSPRGTPDVVDPCPRCGPECYARLLNATAWTYLYDEQRFCPRCHAHLGKDGPPCLSGCNDNDALRAFTSRRRKPPKGEPPTEPPEDAT